MKDVTITEKVVVLSIGSGLGTNQFLLQPKDAIDVMEILMGATQLEGHWPRANDDDKRSHRMALRPISLSINVVVGEIVSATEAVEIKTAAAAAEAE